MLPDFLLNPADDRSRPFDSTIRRSPILALSEVDGGNKKTALSKWIRLRSVHAIAPTIKIADRRDGQHAGCGDLALHAWRLVQERFDAVCVGLIDEPGSAIASAARILAESSIDGTAPGGVALLGYEPVVTTTCLNWQNSGDCLPLMIILPYGDPSLSACAVACRDLRSAGVSVILEVMRDTKGVSGGFAIPEFVVELDRFFEDHLAPPFPKLQ